MSHRKRMISDVWIKYRTAYFSHCCVDDIGQHLLSNDCVFSYQVWRGRSQLDERKLVTLYNKGTLIKHELRYNYTNEYNYIT